MTKPAAAPREIVETLDLIEPCELGQVRVETLEFHKPKAKDLRGLPEDEVSVVLRVASRLTGVVETVLDQMSVEDYVRVREIVASFLPKPPATSDESPQS